MILLSGCFSNDRHALNENNSFYIKAEKFRKNGDFNNAVEAFSQCIRHSPGSYKAHLQLAIIFEDNLENLSGAIVQYQNYINKSPEKNQILIAQKWLRRAEEKYYNSLKIKYEDKDISKSLDAEASAEIIISPQDTGINENSESFYVVRSGDTLNEIAKNLLGDSQHWSLLYEANRDVLYSPGQLQVGQRLIIPQLNPTQNHN